MTSLLFDALKLNDQEAMKKMSMIIARVVRDELEDVASDHLPNQLMPEINKLVRKGIYNSLFALANYSADEFSRKFVNLNIVSIPEYWEEPELIPELVNSLEQLGKEILFKSPFLDQQFEVGNIYRLANTRYIRIKGSYEFKDVAYEDGKKHLSKITGQLHKENYIFDYCVGGYSRSDVI